jgi:hypothetical protein
VLIYLDKIGGLEINLKSTTEEKDKEKADVVKLNKEIDVLTKKIADETKNHNEIIKDNEKQSQEAQSKEKIEI